MEQDANPGSGIDNTASTPDAFLGTSSVTSNTSRFSFVLANSQEELRVLEFKGIEAISTPYEYQLTLATKNDLLEQADFMSQSGVLSLIFDEHTEYLHGEISQFHYLHEQGDFVLYQVMLVPKFWFLGKRYNQRIFQQRSVPEIIEQVFSDAGISAQDYELRLSNDYPAHDYCVQYNESEMDFLSRLMEEEGLHYHFEHQAQKHIMVISDQNNAFIAIQGDESVQYHPQSGQNQQYNVINALTYKRKTRYGQTRTRDYNFTRPSEQLEQIRQADSDTALEEYYYPGEYSDNTFGTKKARLKLEQRQCLRESIAFNSNHHNLRAGTRFNLYQHPNPDYNQGYLLIQVEHSGTQPQALDEYGAGNQSLYNNHCQAIPLDVPYRHPNTTRCPHIAGYHSAVITGPDGEEIYTNEHAQSKVQFPWDREGQLDERSSCWLRSTQSWAGKHWGTLVLPRMGQEAKISFIHGDPDRPMISGRVYHELNKVPYALPKHSTRSTFKSNSTLGGQGYNEIRMEDKTGNEQVFIHAQKDMDIRAKNDRRDIVQHDRHLIVDNNRYEHIRQNSHHSTDKNLNEKTGQNRSLSVGKNQHEQIGQAALTEVSDQIHFKSGQKIVLEAGVELTIKAGGGFIKIDPSGITAQGAKIDLNGSTSGDNATLADPQPALLAAEADKNKPGQSFKPIDPQQVQETPAISFNDLTGRPLQPAIQGMAPLPLEPATANKKTRTTWVEILILNEKGQGLSRYPYQIEYANGSIQKGLSDSNGFAHIEGLIPGSYSLSLLNSETIKPVTLPEDFARSKPNTKEQTIEPQTPAKLTLEHVNRFRLLPLKTIHIVLEDEFDNTLDKHYSLFNGLEYIITTDQNIQYKGVIEKGEINIAQVKMNDTFELEIKDLPGLLEI